MDSAAVVPEKCSRRRAPSVTKSAKSPLNPARTVRSIARTASPSAKIAAASILRPGGALKAHPGRKASPKTPQMWHVYILECENGSLYTGVTTDVLRRFKEHQNKSARYTSYNPPVHLVYSESCHGRSDAFKREAEIKRWPRRKKLAFIARLSIPP